MATPNALFAIINVANPEALKQRLGSIAPWLSYELQDGQWLLIAPAGTTSKEASDKLGITSDNPSYSPTSSIAVVLRVDSYYGRNHAVVWDWIKSKQGTELVPNATTV
jgi:hypothetical protein